MSLKLSVLASGSSGNCTYLSDDTTEILIDAGLSGRQIEQRLESIGTSIAHVDGICLSHEHSDHISAARILQKRHDLPVYANGGTIEAIRNHPKESSMVLQQFETGTPFSIGAFQIETFSIPHDAYEPVGFIIRHQVATIGVVTDIGMVTESICQKLRGCHALVVESNYDEDLLREAPRPWSLKQRIRSRQGHLSNLEAAQLIMGSHSEQLTHVILAHLSSECNTAELALTTVQSQLRFENISGVSFEVSNRAHPTPLFVLDAKKPV